MENPDLTTRLRLRLLFGDDAMLGPGKVELLEHIAGTGSISAAGRAMGMSYKRAWSLVEEMNAAFKDPLVQSSRGGLQGGGASLTDAGNRVIATYRDLVTIVEREGAAQIMLLRSMLNDMSDGK